MPVMSEVRRERQSYFTAKNITAGKFKPPTIFWPYRCKHEKDYAERQQMEGIQVQYESVAFDIDLGGGKIRRWIPDFYLPATDEFVEINCASNREKNKKIEAFRKQYPLIKLNIIQRPGGHKARVRSVKD
jgi:hypothetical protein